MAKPKVAPKKKASNGYKIAEPLPLEQTLEDISKKKWKLGTSIGQGGFGAIYSAKEATANGPKYPYVIKIEPHSNGPLFVEKHFYMRNAKREDVEAFKKKNGLKTLGMPLYFGSGSHEYNGEKYRFIVMEKFGLDLWKIFLDNGKVFPTSTVFKIAIQILDILEYIHSKGYVHADIKGANILMGVTKESQNKQVYLVDFGLATKYSDNLEFKPNPKRAHDGTIEYLSRDAHLGVQTRRGDLEILAYNLIHWLGCVLPWEKKLTDVKFVQKSKEESMSNISKFLSTCFSEKSPPGPLVEFFKYLVTLKHNTMPDYKKIRKIFASGLDSNDGLDKPFNFSTKSATKKTPVKSKSTPISTPNRRSPRKKAISESSGDDESDGIIEEAVVPQRKKPTKRTPRTPVKRRSNGTPVSIPTQRPSRKEAISDDESDEIIQETVKKPTKKTAKNSKPKRKKIRDSSESSEDEKENSNEDFSSSSIEEVIPKVRQRRRNDNLDFYEELNHKQRTVKKRKEMPVSNLNGVMREILQKKLQKQTTKRTKKEKEDDVDTMDGYTESMKEIELKKQGIKSRDSMEGFTESMREIAMKRKQRLAKMSGK